MSYKGLAYGIYKNSHTLTTTEIRSSRFVGIFCVRSQLLHAGSSLLCVGVSLVVACGLRGVCALQLRCVGSGVCRRLSSCGVWAQERVDSLGVVWAQERVCSSCVVGSGACALQLLYGFRSVCALQLWCELRSVCALQLWCVGSVPQPEIEPLSLRLEDEFLANGPPGKSQIIQFKKWTTHF